jgi:PAS domain S-box-containing protein
MGYAKNAEEGKADRLVTVLRTLRNVNRLLEKEKNRKKLIKEICNTLVTARGYYNAWIVLFDQNGDIAETAQTGLGNKFTSMLRQWKRHGITKCGKETVSRQGVILTEDPQSMCQDCILSQEYEGRSALTTRLEHEGRVLGILCISTPKNLVADEEEQKLIQEVGRDIALALSSIETEEAKSRAERLLQESEDRYRTVFDNSGTAIMIIEEDTSLSMVNAQFEKLSGYSKKELVGNMNWTDFVGEEDRGRMLEFHYKRRKDEKSAPSEYEFHFIDKGGIVKNILCRVSMIPGTKRSIASLIDITSLRLAEKARQESEERFRDLIENSPIGISFIQSGKVVYRNPEQQRLFGPHTESSIPFNMDNIHPDDVEKVSRMYQELSKGKTEAFQTEFRFFPEGKVGSKPDIKWVDCRANRVKYKGEDAILVNMLDTTRSKELEHYLLIQDKMASLGHMAAGIAHEIRNPLSGINIYLNTLEKRLKKNENMGREIEITEQIKSASYKIESVIRRVMDFSKPGEPKFVLSDINEPINEAVKLASVTLRKSKIRINAVLTKNMPSCLIDPHLIEEVLLNLITNAADAMNEMETEKIIEIVTLKLKNVITVSVSDSGPGIPFHLRDKIFDPFYTTKSDSSGIGLSISHRIITDHGGSIDIGTSKWGGAEFKVRIPIKQEKG